MVDSVTKEIDHSLMEDLKDFIRLAVMSSEDRDVQLLADHLIIAIEEGLIITLRDIAEC